MSTTATLETREVKYIRYDEQDAYREAGWTIRPFEHAPHHREYRVIASRAIVVQNKGRAAA